MSNENSTSMAKAWDIQQRRSVLASEIKKEDDYDKKRFKNNRRWGRGDFRCLWCREAFLSNHQREPSDGEMAAVTFVNYADGYFRKHSREEERHRQDCLFINPLQYMKHQATWYGLSVYELTDINMKIDLRSKDRSTSSRRSPNHIQRSYGPSNKNHIHFLDTILHDIATDATDTTDTFLRNITVRTEDNKEKTLTNLIRSPQSVIEKGIHDGEYYVFKGRIKHVNEISGFINIYFETESKTRSSSVQLFVCPTHYYTKDALMPLEDRFIACYGQVTKRQGYYRIELKSIDTQMVFLDGGQRIDIVNNGISEMKTKIPSI